MIEANEVPTKRIVAFSGSHRYKLQGPIDHSPRVFFSTSDLTSEKNELPPSDFIPVTIDDVPAIFLFYKGNVAEQIPMHDPSMSGISIHNKMKQDSEKRITLKHALKKKVGPDWKGMIAFIGVGPYILITNAENEDRQGELRVPAAALRQILTPEACNAFLGESAIPPQPTPSAVLEQIAAAIGRQMHIALGSDVQIGTSNSHHEVVVDGQPLSIEVRFTALTGSDGAKTVRAAIEAVLAAKK